MASNRRLSKWCSIFWLLVGAALIGLGTAEIIDNFWSGMGGGLMGVGLLQTVRNIRYRKDAEYREKTDTENNDERNKFIANKAWAWAGYLFVIIAAAASIVLKIVGLDEYVYFACGCVCSIVIFSVIILPPHKTSILLYYSISTKK